MISVYNPDKRKYGEVAFYEKLQELCVTVPTWHKINHSWKSNSLGIIISVKQSSNEETW